VRDLKFVAALDVDAKKVCRDLAEAITAASNKTITFAEVPTLGIEVQRAPTLDGLGGYYREVCRESDLTPVNIAAELHRAAADVLVCYPPVSSEEATGSTPPRRWRPASRSSTACWYSSQAIRCGRSASRMLGCRSSATTSRVKSAPRSPTGSSPACSRAAGLRSIELISSTSAATWMHEHAERSRLTSKKISKTRSVTSQMTSGVPCDSIHIGRSDHVPWVEDRKWAYVGMEGRNFGDIPVNVDLKLRCGILRTALAWSSTQCGAQRSLDRGVGGPLLGPSSYDMKSPPARSPTTSAARWFTISSPRHIVMRILIVLTATLRVVTLSERCETTTMTGPGLYSALCE
jgi:myo-inositol-1-phosphate synthase